MMHSLFIFVSLSFGPMPNNGSSGPQNVLPEELKEVRIDEKLGSKLPNVTLIDESGDTLHLYDLLGKKPLVLSFAYYTCKNLCPMVLDAISEALRGLSLKPGKDFNLLTMSFDPLDTPDRAKEISKMHRHGFVPKEAWKFTVTDSQNIYFLTNSAGYFFKKEGDQFAHPTATLVVTPDGKISRYLYGIDYKSRDLKLALLEASNGKIGSITDKILLFCYRYDPKTRKYALVAIQVMKLGGLITLIFVGGVLGFLWVNERRRTNS